MDKYIFIKLLKYCDCFGIRFNFYSERNRKFYTPLGGLLSLLSIIVGFLVFIFINRDEFSHNKPISTTSTSKVPNTKIKFLEEKIWIPWRIRDYNSRTLNFTNLLYPIAFYYRGVYNETRKALDLSYSIINYRLCNEASMANYTDSFTLDIALDKIYCIDMDDLEMGGNWDTDYVFYLQFDLYACKNGIDYDEKNPNCSTYEKIIEAAGEDNSFSFDLFYPIVHYQPMVKEKPLFVKYANYFYHLSRFTNKIDRIYLQKYQLKDDNGWIIKNEKIYNHWGYVSLSGDSYSTGDKKDLMNEGSSSRLYSFNIYVNSDVVYYSRNYKSLFLIISDGLPNVNIIIIIFRMIAKIFKISSGNQKLTELLFENLQERPNRLKGIKIKGLQLAKDKKIIGKNSNKKLDITINKTIKNKINETSLPLNSAYEVGQKIIRNITSKRKNSLHSTDKPKLSSFNQNNINKNRLSHKNFELIKVNNYMSKSKSKSNSNSNNDEELSINKLNDISSFHFSKLNVR